ncbi:MAG: hypothetical protein WCW16_04895 [Candidatus Magasanikbacteria bacterium]|jgi:hypothetical protein
MPERKFRVVDEAGEYEKLGLGVEDPTAPSEGLDRVARIVDKHLENQGARGAQQKSKGVDYRRAA